MLLTPPSLTDTASHLSEENRKYQTFYMSDIFWVFFNRTEDAITGLSG